jgi:hypothetical protein
MSIRCRLASGRRSMTHRPSAPRRRAPSVTSTGSCPPRDTGRARRMRSSSVRWRSHPAGRGPARSSSPLRPTTGPAGERPSPGHRNRPRGIGAVKDEAPHLVHRFRFRCVTRSTQDYDHAVIGPHQTEQDPQERRLSSPVRTDEAMDRTSVDPQIEMVDRTNLAEVLHQASRFDRGEGIRHGSIRSTLGVRHDSSVTTRRSRGSLTGTASRTEGS